MDLQITKLLLMETIIVTCLNVLFFFFSSIISCINIYNIYNNYYNIMLISVWCTFVSVSIKKIINTYNGNADA